MFQLFLSAVILLAATTQGQLVIDDISPCTAAQYLFGTRLIGHDYCDLYYNCDATRKWVKACPEALIFDTVYGVCNAPTRSNCAAVTCNANSPAQNYRLKCCDSYLRCAGGVLNYFRCPAGQVFDVNSGTCTPNGICQDHPLCVRRVSSNVVTVEAQCYRSPVAGDPCSYRETDAANNDFGVRPCAAGTAFNQSTCSCSILNDGCLPGSARVNRVINTDCRDSVRFDFSNGLIDGYIPTYTYKNAAGTRMANAFRVVATGLSLANGEAYLATTPTGEVPYLSIPFYSQNMFFGSFRVKVTFRANTNNGGSFLVFGNEVASRVDCSNPTLAVRATWRGNQWQFNFVAVGLSEEDTRTTGTFSGSLNTRSADSYVTVSVVFNSLTKTITGYASDSNSRQQQTLGSAIIGDKIASNNCNFFIGYGLVGYIREAVITEACGDATHLSA